jgi:mutator protein MutT
LQKTLSAPVDVAVAVLIRSDGAALLAQRPHDKVYSGHWEFPGGKIEPGELVAEALKREIREELGIEIVRAHPWITRVFTYPHATVRLRFYRVTARMRSTSIRSCRPTARCCAACSSPPSTPSRARASSVSSRSFCGSKRGCGAA